MIVGVVERCRCLCASPRLSVKKRTHWIVQLPLLGLTRIHRGQPYLHRSCERKNRRNSKDKQLSREITKSETYCSIQDSSTILMLRMYRPVGISGFIHAPQFAHSQLYGP
ncbi:hypothetical protein F2P81_020219 [Scophthalmus maximus]|uniref:Uncharacterized protein n=1 Tax=Scophthalmus maximus TaxID=52904 RepID=A0A6A4S5J5_SCOMX|nr:hypothetical protein F2P81_020219 [Scophthalmus maximus]